MKWLALALVLPLAGCGGMSLFAGAPTTAAPVCPQLYKWKDSFRERLAAEREANGDSAMAEAVDEYIELREQLGMRCQ